MKPFVLIWGGGDLASGVAIRLKRVGIRVLIVEIPQPLAVRRGVAFAQAVFDGEISVEGVTGLLIHHPDQMLHCWVDGQVPVIVDPQLGILAKYPPLVVVDARMRKLIANIPLDTANLVVGLGPGFIAGENCHAAVETNRGHLLGRVYWQGATQADTGVPGKVEDYAAERVFHTPVDGSVESFVDIGDRVNSGDPLMKVGEHIIYAPFAGVVRGLIHPKLVVKKGTKVGDLDPRLEAFRCWSVSEKSLSIAGGVLEAILTQPGIRARLWDD